MNRTIKLVVIAAALLCAQFAQGADEEGNLKAQLAAIEKHDGKGSLAAADVLNKLGLLYLPQARFVEAEAAYKESLAIRQKLLQPDHRDIVEALASLGVAYLYQGRLPEAESLLKQSLAIGDRALDPFDEGLADILLNLAVLAHYKNNDLEAEKLCKRSIAINEKARNSEHPNIGVCLNLLGQVYQAQGRYVEAEKIDKQSLALREKAFGTEHPSVALALNNLATLYVTQGRYFDAEQMLKRSLAIQEKALGPEHPEVGASLSNLASLYRTQGNYAEAEPLYMRSLAIEEKALGPDHPSVGTLLNNLAGLYADQGRYAEAESLYKRGLAIAEKALGPDHPDVGISLSNLAEIYLSQGRYTEAVQMLTRGLAIEEKALGPDHPSVGTLLSNLAGLYAKQGRSAEAEPLYKRSLAIAEKALGPDHPDVGTRLNNLAMLYHAQGRYADAEPLYKRSLAIIENAFGPGHPEASTIISNLAVLYRDQQRIPEALTSIRRSTSILRGRIVKTDIALSGEKKEQQLSSDPFLVHLDILSRALDGVTTATGVEESFEVGQLARASSTSDAVVQMAARFSASTDALAQVVRQRQDLAARWQHLNEALIKAVSAPPDKLAPERVKQLRSQLTQAESELRALDQRIGKDYPAYRELTRTDPIKVPEAQDLLGSDEALLVYVVDSKQSYLWVLRPTQAQFIPLKRGRNSLKDSVQLLRQGVDLSRVNSIEKLPAFDVKEAAELYQTLWQPVRPYLEGVHHVFVVADGPLQSLPFGLLLEGAPRGEIKRTSDYRSLPWLAKRYAFSTLPAVSALRALRQFTKGQLQPDQPFIGFGDPLLSGGQGKQRGLSAAQLFTRGAVADVDNVRALPRLPDTATELIAQSKLFKANQKNVYLREQDTEHRVKQTDLSHYRVVSFATHGLLAGDIKGVAEPALVFTPPKSGTTDDDGLLTASEVALLKLNADWVVMSACNTAGPNGEPGAEGLSGLAKAFFYAGARSLLVSHWPVSSEATVALMTRTFEAYSAHPKQGRAEALRLGMVSLMNDPSHTYFAHPAFWAPFVLVGEGER